MADKNEHINREERTKWDKVVVDFANHLGSGGDSNHRRANGTVSGFSINDYTTPEKTKLAGIQDGALNNPHPATHPYTMITGLGTVAHTNRYSDLSDIPETFRAGGGNSDTVGGIRITISSSFPGNPQNNKELHIHTSNSVAYYYSGNEWKPIVGVYA